MHQTKKQPLFPLGQIVATPGALAALENQHPRWMILSAAARTLLGDTEAAGRLRDMMKSDASGAAAIKVVKTAIQPLLGDRPEQTIESFASHRSRVLAALHDANEATVGEFKLAA